MPGPIDLRSAPGSPLALPGAVGAARFVGATASGAPSSGTFKVGDFVVDQSGQMWICTVAGTPGTWVDTGSGKRIAYAEDKTTRTTTSASLVDYPSLSITFPHPGKPVAVTARLPTLSTNLANQTIGMFVHFASPNRTYDKGGLFLSSTSGSGPGFIEVDLPLVGDYEPAFGDSVTAKLQWNTTGGTATSTAIASGSNRLWPKIKAVVL